MTAQSRIFLLCLALTLLPIGFQASLLGQGDLPDGIRINRVSAAASVWWHAELETGETLTGNLFVARSQESTWMDFSLEVDGELRVAGLGFVPEECVELTEEQVQIECNLSPIEDYWTYGLHQPEFCWNCIPYVVSLSLQALPVEMEHNGGMTEASGLFLRSLNGNSDEKPAAITQPSQLPNYPSTLWSRTGGRILSTRNQTLHLDLR